MPQRGTLSPGEAPGPPSYQALLFFYPILSDHPPRLWISFLLSKGYAAVPPCGSPRPNPVAKDRLHAAQLIPAVHQRQTA
jgi:hypothetical protein